MKWRALHRLGLAAVVLGFVHSLLLGRDLAGTPMRLWWTALLGLAVVPPVWRHLAVNPGGRRRFTVRKVIQETHNTFTLLMEPEKGGPLRHLPGQYMFLTLMRKGLPTEEHPFTIASSPVGDGPLSATIKKCGDFTNTIDQTRPGDTALVEGPFGEFSFLYHDPEALLMVAGGVGITPIMSMLRFLRDTRDPRPALLIYANRTEEDIIFRAELEAMPPGVRVVHVLSRPDADWSGPKGHVDAALIQEHAGPLLERAHAYVCGPPPMMQAVIQALRSLGMPQQRIHYELFSL